MHAEQTWGWEAPPTLLPTTRGPSGSLASEAERLGIVVIAIRRKLAGREADDVRRVWWREEGCDAGGNLKLGSRLPLAPRGC